MLEKLKFNTVNTRGAKLWISCNIDTEDYYYNISVEVDLKSNINKIIYINKREYILIAGERELGKDNHIFTLGSEIDNEIIDKAIKYLNDNKYIDKVLKRLEKKGL